jgi:hypothetical protein
MRNVAISVKEHPAEKPIGLIKEQLRVCGDVIVDLHGVRIDKDRFKKDGIK